MKYTSLFKRTPEQDIKTVFAFFPFNKDKGENWQAPYESLAEIAKPEDWNFHRLDFKTPTIHFPILTSYLNYTFLRLQDQNKIQFVDDKACFNTGLQTPDEKEIFAVFSKNKKDNEADYFFNGWFNSYNMRGFRPLPEIATYIEDVSDLVFDTTYAIDVNSEHILDENQDRLPELLKSNRHIALGQINSNIESLRQKCIRNYKTAIPFWYPPESKIQLLLPLCLMIPNQADLALVANKSKSEKLYRIRTALTMDMAYNNARLITRPDRDWLNP